MKTEHEILIDAPQAKVWKTMDTPELMPQWQQNLVSFSHVSGTPGQPGAVSKLIYDENGKEVVLTETVTERREPDFIAGIYEAEHGKSIIVTHLESVSDNQTRWKVYANHEFYGLMKIFGWFIRGSICRRTEADMNRLKLLVESGQD